MSHDFDSLANNLERALVAHESGSASPGATHAAPTSADARLAVALIDLASGIQPDLHWAANLELRLLAHGPVSATADGPPHSGASWPPTQPRWMTPRRVSRHWSVLGSVAAALILALLLFAPQVQAAVRAVLQLGAVHIATTTPTPLPGAVPSATPLHTVLDLAGETTLADARQQAGFSIVLPAYPPDLGPPNHVYLQDLGGPMVVLVWTVPGRPTQVRMSLHELSSNIWLQKFPPHVVQTTTVNGQPALWTDGPYEVEVIVGDQVAYGSRRLVTGHVLIWATGSITYRLETSLTLPEAIRVAESLH